MLFERSKSLNGEVTPSLESRREIDSRVDSPGMLAFIDVADGY